MSKRPQTECAQHAGDARTDRALYNADLEPLQPTCLACRLRDAADRRETLQWLASAQQRRQETFGTLFCPLHAWRAWEVAHLVTQPSTSSAGEWHRCLAALLARPLSMLAAQLTEVGKRFSDTGWRGSLTALLGDKPPALLWDRPPCPVCAAFRRDQRDTALLHTFDKLYTPLQLNDRQLVVAHLCLRDRQLCQFFIRDTAARSSKPRHFEQRHWPQWWIAGPELGGEDRSFVMRLLEGDQYIRDETCPACFVRAEHEYTLLAEVRPKSKKETMTSEMEGLVEDLCSRHAALVGLGTATEESQKQHTQAQRTRETSALPPRWPAGTLRSVSHERGCVICATLWGWELLRMEGLRRAAGSTALQTGITEQLAAVLKAHHYVFCLPHWQAVTVTAPREVTLTLLPTQQQGLAKLLTATRAHTDRLERTSPGTDVRVETGHHETDPCAAVLDVLAGYPG